MPSRDWLVRYADGREERVAIGRPADLVWYADTFNRDPADEGVRAYADACRLIHRALGPDAPPFEEWIETLEEVVSPSKQTEAVLAAELDLEGSDPSEPSEDEAQPSAEETLSARESLVLP